jgi:IS30 family transposase
MPSVIGPAFGRPAQTIRGLIRRAGGIAPVSRQRSSRHLSLREREEISRGLGAGESLRAIARRLGRAPSTVSREVGRNGGAQAYRAVAADRRADEQASRPKEIKLATRHRLRARVQTMLKGWWSPEQIAARLRRDYPDEPEMWVSHETIYQSLFVQGRGALRKELAACLRRGRATRRPRRPPSRQAGVIQGISISERPAEVEDRAVPGHWEGDLLIGAKNQSAVVVLVERASRYVLLGRLGNDHSAEAVRMALVKMIRRLPAELAKTLTWDRGSEMAEHAQFSVATGVAVYFCDPRSPWQRGSNENTNGLLRQYMPKVTDLSVHSQARLNAFARSLNNRPRETLDWLKPAEKFAEFVASTV